MLSWGGTEQVNSARNVYNIPESLPTSFSPLVCECVIALDCPQGCTEIQSILLAQHVRYYVDSNLVRQAALNEVVHLRGL